MFVIFFCFFSVLFGFIHAVIDIYRQPSYVDDISNFTNTGGTAGATFSTISSTTYCPSSSPCWHIIGPGILVVYPITRQFTLTWSTNIYVSFDIGWRSLNTNEYIEFGYRCNGGTWTSFNYLSNGFNMNAVVKLLNEVYYVGTTCNLLEISFNLYISGSGDHVYINNIQIYHNTIPNPIKSQVFLYCFCNKNT